MKKIVSALFLFSVITAFAQEAIQFQELPFKDLIAKAKKENKIVFIDAFTSWCGPCKMMERNIFTKKYAILISNYIGFLYYFMGTGT